MIANSAAQHRILGLKSIQYGTLSCRTVHLNADLAPGLRKISEMKRKNNSNHV